jgi:AraC-like DNA-binding protein
MERNKELAELIARYAKEDGAHETAIPRLHVFRRSTPSEPVHAVHKAAICFIAQGRKQMILGEEVFHYGPSQHLLVSMDLPVMGRVIEASEAEPYLGMKLEFDLDLAAAMILKTPAPTEEMSLGVMTTKTSPELLDAAIRLLKLHESPEDAAELAPLIEREIIYRLLKSDQCGCVRRMLQPQAHHRHVGRAITWIKENYTRSFSIEEVASLSGMSPSSLHQHFREATAMSPLQYQKQLRLQEARRLILSRSIDAATAGHSVGYDSPSQFSREYKRLFGAPPQRDIDRLRTEPQRYAEA